MASTGSENPVVNGRDHCVDVHNDAAAGSDIDEEHDCFVDDTDMVDEKTRSEVESAAVVDEAGREAEAREAQGPESGECTEAMAA